MQYRVSALLLAAGLSRRMGQCKQLLPLNGRPTVVMCLDAIIAAGIEDVTVVVGPTGNEVTRAFAHLPVNVVRNDAIGSDMAQSVRAGLPALPAGTGGVLVCLVDHPLVTTETYHRLIDEHRHAPEAIIVPLHNGRKGHPTLFPRTVIAELAVRPTLRDIIGAHQELVRLLPVDDPAVIDDMDTPDDYRRLVERLAR